METKDTLSSCSNSARKQQNANKFRQKQKESGRYLFDNSFHTSKHLFTWSNLKETRIDVWNFKLCMMQHSLVKMLKLFIGTMFPKHGSILVKANLTKKISEIGSIASFKVLAKQFQLFIKVTDLSWNDEYKSIDERAQHKREYDSWVNERQIQTAEDKVDTGKAVDASLVNTESIGTESKEQDTSSRSGNDAHADDADIRPIYDEESMVEEVEQCHDTCPLPAKLTDNQTT
ncbi:hypothetical protein Tco_0588733 [Tanacetum coccineum]